MSLNGKKVGEFALKAYKNGEFIDVTDKDLQGKWSVLFFYPADFTFVCPTELEDLQNKYAEFRVVRHPLRSQGLARILRTYRQGSVPDDR